MSPTPAFDLFVKLNAVGVLRGRPGVVLGISCKGAVQHLDVLRGVDSRHIKYADLFESAFSTTASFPRTATISKLCCRMHQNLAATGGTKAERLSDCRSC